MISEAQYVEAIKQAKESDKEHKFTHAIEMITVFRDIDVKKGFALNETVQLPNKMNKPAQVCIMASGDMGTKAKKANADRVMNEEEITKIGSNKRESRKFINKYDFFLADTKLMPIIGKVLGQLLGPRGKMPTPIPFNASIESFLERFRDSIKIRTKGSLSLSCKIGDETMDDDALASNANTIISSIEKKLPNGSKNIKKIMFKTTMGKVIQIEDVKN
jgi:large subunit ribosomal protein L1|tara:strand:+ start:303 stop:956 length:654 start_codon:yes stop_codon:yes gene_type:complete